MRSMYSKDELLKQTAKKKPRLQALIDGLDSMSKEEIMNLSEPLWVRDALVVLKETNNKSQKERKIEFVAEMNEKERLSRAQEVSATYDVRLWTSELSFFKGSTLDGSRGWEVEIKHGEPFMVKDSNVILVAGEFYRLSQTEMLRIVDNSKYFMETTLQGYFNYYREDYLNKMH